MTPQWSNISFGEDGSTREIVSVKPKTQVWASEPTSPDDAVVETVNYDALSIWQKLKDAPNYKKAQQIMAVLTDKMNTQSF